MPAAVFLVFLLLGPPIGSAIFVVEMVAAVKFGLLPSPSFSGGSPNVLGLILGIAVFSYPVGGVQALLTALVALISLDRNRGTMISLPAVLLASSVPSIIFVVLAGDKLNFLPSGLIVVSWHLGAGFGAWLISTVMIKIAGRETIYAPPAEVG
jgi:hypothetical protein